MSSMRSLKVIKNALSEVFAKSMHALCAESESYTGYTEKTQEAEKNMIQMLQKLETHFGLELLRIALKEPLNMKHLPDEVMITGNLLAEKDAGEGPSGVYPLAQCIYWFCSPKALHSKQRCGPFLLQLMNDADALMQESDLFVLKSNPYPNGIHLFDKKRFSAWDLGIIAADYFFIKQALPLAQNVQEEHLFAFDFYHALPDPMYWELQVQLKSKAEQELLDAVISENTQKTGQSVHGKSEESTEGGTEGRRRRKAL